MSIRCNVCSSAISAPLYTSPGDLSMSSLGEVINEKTTVHFCEQCCHLQTQEIQDIDEYYDKQYKMLINSEDEDQIYKCEKGERIYRYDHQAKTALSKLNLSQGANILEYGAAKGATLKRMLASRPDLEGYVFDVSEMYSSFWDRFIEKSHQSTYTTPESWNNNFDHVVSFYVLEHVSALREVIANIRKLLRDGGTFYFIVPNTYDNIADFVVADHTNHFSELSIRHLLEQSGFGEIAIDVRTHESAFIVKSKKIDTEVTNVSLNERNELKEKAISISCYWQDIAEKITQFEADGNSRTAAIYGAGFYGSFIYCSLKEKQNIQCFVDHNPHLHERKLFGKTILPPNHLPDDVDTLYVGLNPKYAQGIIDDIDPLRQKALNTLFL